MLFLAKLLCVLCMMEVFIIYRRHIDLLGLSVRPKSCHLHNFLTSQKIIIIYKRTLCKGLMGVKVWKL